jgi:hypothetical protein
MAKKEVRWKKEPARENYGAALSYLSLLCPPRHANTLIRGLRGAKTVDHAAKDLLRASGLALLPREEPHVTEDLKRIHKGKPLSPILLIQGDMGRHIPLLVADGYHRICAICYFDENSPIPCRMITA